MKENIVRPLPSRMLKAIESFIRENDGFFVGVVVPVVVIPAALVAIVAGVCSLLISDVTKQSIKASVDNDHTKITVRGTINGALSVLGQAEAVCTFVPEGNKIANAQKLVLSEASAEILLESGTSMLYGAKGLAQGIGTQQGFVVTKTVDDKKEISAATTQMDGKDLHNFRTNMTEFCGLAQSAVDIYKAEEGAEIFVKFVNVPSKSDIDMNGSIIGDGGTVIVLGEHKTDEPKKISKTEVNKLEAVNVAVPLPRSMSAPLGPLYLANPNVPN